MNENNTQLNIKARILDEIKNGKINMKPKFYFMLRVVSLIVVALVTLLISCFLVSFIIFSIVQSGRLFLLGFGLRGITIFLTIFPWSLLGFEIVLIILLQWLIKKFRYGYTSSFTTLILLILCVSLGVSILIDVTPLHNVLQNRAEHRQLPVVGGFYRSIRRPPPREGLFRGTVSFVGTSSFSIVQTIDTDDNGVGSSTNVLFSGTLSSTTLSVGDGVLIVGEPLPGFEIRAFGIQKLPRFDAQ